MPTILQSFREACDKIEALAPGRRLLLGCSAGGDSMALLDLVARERKRRRWTVAVAHLDHAQRPESADEARFVAEQAAARGLPCFVERLAEDGDRIRIGAKGGRGRQKTVGPFESSPPFPPDGGPRKAGRSSIARPLRKAARNATAAAAPSLSEDAMRQARHEFFGRAAAEFKADAVVLAHQADDRAETFLIRLIAGSGPTGLSSIRPLERVGGLVIARPLLELRREDLRRYNRARRLKWHDDPSNDDTATRRGWVRNTLLPAMREKIALDPTARINRAAELIDDEAAALTSATQLILEQLRAPAEPPAIARLQLDHPLWRGADSRLRRQLLRQWIWALRKRPHPPGYAAAAAAQVFAEQARRGAELRTVERIIIVHGKSWLIAFGPDVASAARLRAFNKTRNPRSEIRNKSD